MRSLPGAAQAYPRKEEFKGDIPLACRDLAPFGYRYNLPKHRRF